MGEAAPRVLVADDEATIRESLAKVLKREGYRVFTADDGDTALDLIRRHGAEAALVDLKMPRVDGVEFLRTVKAIAPEVEVILMTGHGTVEVAVEAMKEGAYDFIPKPFKRLAITKVLRRALEKRALAVENRQLREKLKGVQHRPAVGNSASIRSVLEVVEQVAPSTANVLITGESGTGKDVIAHAIHFASPRRDQPFIKVSCAAIPETLLEAELFGHEKGAFTGAISRREGRFRMAHGGTLFLDEVGEIPPAMQVKLLRVIQDGEFERLGGGRTIRADVRLLAATNRDLSQAVREKSFREDLFYRLNVIPIALPPLRDRGEDIPLLADHFIGVYRERNHKAVRGISREALEVLQHYSWPGNVRELENAIERAIVLSRSPVIEVEDLPRSICQESGAAYARSASLPGRKSMPRTRSLDQGGRHRELVVPIGASLAEVEQLMIAETLRHTNGDKIQAARLLGIAERTVYRKLEQRRHSRAGGGAADEGTAGPGGIE